MQKITKFASLLMAMLLLIGLMAGCGGSTQDSSGAISNAGSGDVSQEEDASDTESIDTTDNPTTSDAVNADSNVPDNTSKGNGSGSGNSNSNSNSNGSGNIPSSDAAKWGTEAGTTSVKKTPAWMKNIKSGEIKVLAADAYGEGVENDTYREEKALFKALTGKELKITTKVVEWNSLRSNLQTMVLANDAPDLFSIYNGVGTYLRNKNLTRDIRDYINMNDAAWKDMQKYSEPLFYNGVLTGVCVADPMIGYGILYNKTLINQAGLEDPFALYEKGQWDILKFLEYVEELTVDQNHDNIPEVFGVSLQYESIFRMSCASGIDMVTINNDGTITNNLRNPIFTRWAGYARKIAELGSYDSEPWTAGTRFYQNKVAMMTAAWPTLYGSEKAIEWKKANKLGWVPSPKDINTKTHYHLAEATYTFLPKNSKNPEGAAAYIYMKRYSDLNPSATSEAKKKTKFLNEYGFTEKEYQFYNNINKNKTLVPVLHNWQHIPDFNYYDLAGVYTQDWNVLVEWAYPSLQAAIDKQNK